MSDAHLIADPMTISLVDSGPATGDIVLVAGDVRFPMNGWNDFAIVILDAWLRALLRLLTESSESELVHFMEGPYAVDLRRVSADDVQITAIERPKRTHAIARVRLHSFAQEVACVAEDMLFRCRERGFESADIEQLQAALEALRREHPDSAA